MTAVVDLEDPPLTFVKDVVVGDAKNVGDGGVPERHLAGIVGQLLEFSVQDFEVLRQFRLVAFDHVRLVHHAIGPAHVGFVLEGRHFHRLQGFFAHDSFHKRNQGPGVYKIDSTVIFLDVDKQGVVIYVACDDGLGLAYVDFV